MSFGQVVANKGNKLYPVSISEMGSFDDADKLFTKLKKAEKWEGQKWRPVLELRDGNGVVKKEFTKEATASQPSE